MKNLFRFPSEVLRSVITISLLAIVPALRADTNSPGGTVVNLSAVGPHSRSWTITTTSGSGDSATTNVSAVQEMATGLNYWDGSQWQPSDTSFQLAQGGALAVVNTTQHKVSIASNLAVSNAVTLVTPDGLTLNSSPLSIGLYDAASGNATIIGSITNCTGYFVRSNLLVFSNAFDGICADIWYKVEKGAFHQDVVITGRLDPADWGYPTNTTWIQILTEFYNPPAPGRMIRPLQVTQDPNQRNNMASPDLTDQVLTFGQMIFNTGKAHTLASATLGRRGGALVGKQLVTVSGRTFLIESVPYSWLQTELQSLPVCQSPGTRQGAMLNGKKGAAFYASIPRLPARSQTAMVIKRSPEGLAKASSSHPVGVVIDYESTITGSFAGPFAADATYFISGTVYCSSPVTFEGGTVIKYPYAGSADIELDSDVTFATPSYRPAVFTAGDDTTVGSPITTNIWSGYTGTIQGNNYADPALYLNSGNAETINNIRVNYAAQGVYINAMDNNYTWTVSHSQFLNCVQGIELDYGSGAILQVNNCLLDKVQSVIYDFHGGSEDYYFTHATIDGTTNLFTTDSSVYPFFTNCVLLNITNSTTGFYGDHNGFYQAPSFGANTNITGTYPYQTVGEGNYYLIDGSPFRDWGATNIDSGLLSDLSHRTTYAPLVFAYQTLYYPLTLFPQAQRDARGSPDLGWHYDPIDYAFGYVVVTNAALAVTPGTVIGAFDTNSGISYGHYGLNVSSGSGLIAVGSPTNLCRFVNYNTVQEQSGTNWATPSEGMVVPNFTTNGPNSLIQCRFSDWSVMAQDTSHIYDNAGAASDPTGFQDSQFHGGSFSSQTRTILLTNCLLERVAANFYWYDGTTPLYIRNSLFWNGSFTISRGGATSTNVLIEDTMFDHTTISDRSFTGYTEGYNGYVTNCNRLTQTAASDAILTNSVYLSSYYGNYYIPTNSTLLVHQGSTLAGSLQLYHYTMWTNQVIEGTNTVSIGYHYVAADTNGMPLDTTGTGIPDYIKDANGNGLVDSGEINWTNAADLGLKVIITRPANNSTIP